MVRVWGRITLCALAASFAAIGCREDAPNWKIHNSDIGITIQYPPTWEVILKDVPGFPLVEIVANERRQQRANGSRARGEAWVELHPVESVRFDVPRLFDLCRTVDGWTGMPSEVTLAGRLAVRCVGEGIDKGGLPVVFNGYWVSVPTGEVVALNGFALDADKETLNELQAILASASFGEE